MYYGAWTAVVWSAAHSKSWLGALVALPVVLLCFAWSSDRRALLKLVVLVSFVGVIVDAGLIAAGALHYTPPSTIAPLGPPWMTLLWGMFAATIPLSMSWLFGRWWLGGLLGMIFAPLSYRAAAALGAVQIYRDARDEFGNMLIIAAVWTFVMAAIAHAATLLMAAKSSRAQG